MKIAIPSDNKEQISALFGRTRGFMIYEIENNEILSSEYRDNTFTGHVRGEHHDHSHDNSENNHQQHTHSRILNALYDCEVVIAGGMGRRLLDDLSNANIKVFITRETNINNALSAYIKDSLDHNESSCCDH